MEQYTAIVILLEHKLHDVWEVEFGSFWESTRLNGKPGLEQDLIDT